LSGPAYKAMTMEMRPTPNAATAPTLPTIVSPEFLATLRAHGVASACLFGSVARGEDRPDSDLDLLVTFARPVSLFDQLHLAEGLTRLCGRNVDLMTELDPAFEPYITQTLMPLTV
jgi:predicted nucleotidyltransferase